ncbi:MAG: glycosyltransferase family 1 protein [Actinomycetota bacterium]
MTRRQGVIGVNLLWLVPGVVGGSEEYTVRLLEAVGPHLGDDLRLRLYGRPDLFERYPALVEAHQAVVAPADRSRVIRVARENTWLAAASASDLLVHHAGGTMPVRRSVPGLVTVHDLQPLEFPEFFHPVKRWWLGRAIPAAVRRARLVLCPSRFTADRIATLLDVAPGRLRVISHGHRPVERDLTGLADPADRFGRYLLLPAIAYPHKRHIDLVRAVGRLEPSLGDLSIVLTGRPGPELEAVRAEAVRAGIGDRLHELGRVPVAELELLYRSAQALVFPSAYEGFGNPALEAMSYGCPAIVSDAGALPEVVGDAGLVVPVGDVDGLAAAVAKVVTDRGLADDLRRRGRDRARSFDVGIAAERLAEVYRESVGIGRDSAGPVHR